MRRWPQQLWQWVMIGIVLGCVSGCSLWHTESEEVRQRDAVQRLGVDAVTQMFDPAEHLALSKDDMILVARPDIALAEAKLPADAQVDGPRLRNALVRAILQLKDMPQVVGWAPHNEETELASPLWRLDSHFDAFSPLSLSDRQLFPYSLTLTLQRPGQPGHTVNLSGAFDSQALGPQTRHDSLFSVE